MSLEVRGSMVTTSSVVEVDGIAFGHALQSDRLNRSSGRGWIGSKGLRFPSLRAGGLRQGTSEDRRRPDPPLRRTGFGFRCERQTRGTQGCRVRTSPLFTDNQWIAFNTTVPGTSIRRVFVAPLRATATPRSDWIPVTEGQSLDWRVSWSPGGKLLYFLSDRDGWRCNPEARIWVARDKIVFEMEEVSGNIRMQQR